MVNALRATHSVRVVAPVPWTRRLGAPGRKSTELHPLYWFPPKVLREHYGTFLWLSTRRTLRELTERFQPDAFLSYWAHPDGDAALRASREAGRPCAVIVGGSDVMILAGKGRRQQAIQGVLQRADAVLTVGRTLRERVISLGVSADRVTAFHRGIDTTLFCPGEARVARAKLGLSLDARTALWVGRMVPVKGLDVLLDAWRIVAPRVPAARLLLVGEGPKATALRAQATRLGVDGSVRFVGPRPHEELPDWYRAADVTVLPSLSEGVPNVLLESLACGTPFVATNVGGIHEVERSESCYLVPPGQQHDLAMALDRSLREPQRVDRPISQTVDESAATISRVLERLVSARRSEG